MWSVGCILAELMTRKPFFNGKSSNPWCFLIKNFLYSKGPIESHCKHDRQPDAWRFVGDQKQVKDRVPKQVRRVNRAGPECAPAKGPSTGRRPSKEDACVRPAQENHQWAGSGPPVFIRATRPERRTRSGEAEDSPFWFWASLVHDRAIQR